MNISKRLLGGCAAVTALVLAACGGGSSDGGDASPDRGALYKNPPTRIVAFSAADLTALLNSSAAGQQLQQITGAPKCGLDVRYIQYGTVGGKGEQTTATGAMFVPTGTAEGCSGKRPIVLHAHGTNTSKGYNLALIQNNDASDEAGLIAAMYAAQGYIVVAPNFAGYEASTLGYHPYLNADQQSKDMIDALTAARNALPALGNGTSDSGALFVTGYSAGGHVAIATVRALQEAGKKVAGSAGMSGPYALSAFADGMIGGRPSLGSTVFTTLLLTSYQKSYGDIYKAPGDVYTDAYVKGIETLLPGNLSLSDLFAKGKLPQRALFGTDIANYATVQPQFQVFYGDPAKSLVKTSFANAALADIVKNPCPHQDPTIPLDCKPEHPLRVAAVKNDLRNWTPVSPVLLCGGNADPTVYFFNSQLQQAYWQDKLEGQAKALTTLVDVDSAPGGAADPFAAAKAGFAQVKANAAAAGGAEAVTLAYHGSLVPPFCHAIARGFFGQILAAAAAGG